MGKGNVNNFSSARFYSVISTVKGRHEVEAVFNYNGTEVKRFYYFKNKKGLVDADYVKMAQEQYQKEINNGFLAKYAKGYVGKNAVKTGGHAAVAIAVFSSVAAVALAGLFTWRYLTSRTDPAYHKVTFISGGGTTIDDETIRHGEKAVEPKRAPEIPGRDFQYWSDDKDLSVPYDFNLPVNDNLILYAKYGDLHTQYVTFDYNYYEPEGGEAFEEKEPAPKSVTVKYGEKVARPGDPIRPGYVFDNWYTSEIGSSQQVFNFDKPITANITIYAHWKEHIECKVTFDPNGGEWSDKSTGVKRQTVLYGLHANVNEYGFPTRGGYKFQHWYYFNEEGKHIEYKYNKDTGECQEQVTKDITLYAEWGNVFKCKVTFDKNNNDAKWLDESKAKQDVNWGDKVTYPNPDPNDLTLYGHKFNGWYTSATPGEKDDPFDFTKPYTWSDPQGDTTLTLYAKWDQIYLNINVSPNGGTWNDGSTGLRTFNADDKIPFGTTLGDLKKIAADTDHNKPITLDNPSTQYPLWADISKGYHYERLNQTETGLWEDINDNYKIVADMDIRLNYEQITGTISVSDTYGGFESGKIPTSLNIESIIADEPPYYPMWKDVRDHFMVADTGNVKTGYHLDHYALEEDGAITVNPIPDTYQFNLKDATSFTIVPFFKVDVTFTQDTSLTSDYHMPYGVGQFMTGDKFNPEVFDTYSPKLNAGATSDFEFDYFVDIESVLPDPQNRIYTPTEPEDPENPWYVFTYPTTLKAFYAPKAAENFETDSWPTFLKEINNNTFSYLTTSDDSAYKSQFVNEVTGKKPAGTFVGLVRNVELSSGEVYQARVIDQKVSASDKVSFTFEFTKTLSDTISYGATNTYAGSRIDKFLNNTFIHLLPKSLQDGLTETSREYWYYNGEGNFVKENMSTKIFIPSSFEFGYTVYPYLPGQPVREEGAVLNWYSDAFSTYTDRIKSNLAGTPVPYWTRSAEESLTTTAAWAVDVDGGVGINDPDPIPLFSRLPSSVTDDDLYIAPCFVVGTL